MRLRITNSFTFLELAALAVSLLLAACYSSAAGHLTRHMLLHVGLMTVLAPLLASWLQRYGRSFPGSGEPWFLPLVTITQLVLFFVWHSPQVLTWMMSSPVLHSVLQSVLLLVATAFWSSVLRRSGGAVWSAVIALLLTGKLFCLVALVLVFAPRALYGGGHLHHVSMDLADQQLAGLLMITACPMTYILAAILLVARWLRLLGDEPRERQA